MGWDVHGRDCTGIMRVGEHTDSRIAYYIAFGAHGPRALDPPGETKQVLMYTTLAMVASLLLFIGIRSLGGDPPSTMTREWEEASNEYLKVRYFLPPETTGRVVSCIRNGN